MTNVPTALPETDVLGEGEGRESPAGSLLTFRRYGIRVRPINSQEGNELAQVVHTRASLEHFGPQMETGIRGDDVITHA